MLDDLYAKALLAQPDAKVIEKLHAVACEKYNPEKGEPSGAALERLYTKARKIMSERYTADLLLQERRKPKTAAA